MGLSKIIKGIVDGNPWLSGWYDYLEGDVVAIVDQPEKFMKLKKCRSLKQLLSNLKSFEGVFMYGSFLFFNSYHYGTFVYDVNRPDSYIEHLTVDDMTVEKLQRIVNNLTK
jgi:hypothetical protein